MNKTVMIYDQLGCADICFIVLDGDYQHLHNVYINRLDKPDEVKELSDLLYNEDGSENFVTLEEFPYSEVMQGAYVIVAGFLP